jgi:hypothetical protein
MLAASIPARSSSHATIELEFHMSPAPNSSRPHTSVGTSGTSARRRAATAGSSESRRGLPTASATSGMAPSRQRRTW